MTWLQVALRVKWHVHLSNGPCLYGKPEDLPVPGLLTRTWSIQLPLVRSFPHWSVQILSVWLEPEVEVEVTTVGGPSPKVVLHAQNARIKWVLAVFW